jgi:glycosyltransferase involved in cell wall biosynthesis
MPEYRQKRFAKLMLDNLDFVIKNANAIICFSRFTRKLLSKYAKDKGLTPVNNLFTIPHGIDKNFRRPSIKDIHSALNKFNISNPYLFYAGGLEKDKNIKNLIAAFLNLNEYKDKLNLILAGPDNKESRPLIERIKNMAGFGIRYLGYVDKKSLTCLYSGAECFVSPSLDEGFGLTPLEAIGCKTAAVCSRIPVFRENLGKGAFYFDPENIESICKTLRYVLKNPQEKNKVLALGQKKISKLSWEKSAKDTISVYYKTLKIR